jgi:hypothetical protein
LRIDLIRIGLRPARISNVYRHFSSFLCAITCLLPRMHRHRDSLLRLTTPPLRTRRNGADLSCHLCSAVAVLVQPLQSLSSSCRLCPCAAVPVFLPLSRHLHTASRSFPDACARFVFLCSCPPRLLPLSALAPLCSCPSLLLPLSALVHPVPALVTLCSCLATCTRLHCPVLAPLLRSCVSALPYHNHSSNGVLRAHPIDPEPSVHYTVISSPVARGLIPGPSLRRVQPPRRDRAAAGTPQPAQQRRRGERPRRHTGRPRRSCQQPADQPRMPASIAGRHQP